MSKHSLSRQLPLLIGGLLTLVVGGFAWSAYSRLEDALLTAAHGRLTAASERLAQMLAESSRRRRRDVIRLALDPGVRAALDGSSPGRSAMAFELPDSASDPPQQVVTRLLYSRDCRLVRGTLAAGHDARPAACARPGGNTATSSDGRAISPFESDDDGVHYHVSAVVRGAAGDTLGHLVEVRRLASASNARTLTALVGEGVALRVGNRGGDLWSDFARSVPGPAAAVVRGDLLTYASAAGVPVVSVAQDVPGTPWTVLLEMPRAVALAPARALLVDLSLVALLCIVVGGAGAWLVSRRVVLPLAEISAAARELAAGNYARRARVDRQDELGELATSFNNMAATIESTSAELGTKAHQLEVQVEEGQALARELTRSNEQLRRSLAATSQARHDSARTRSLFDEVLRSAPVGIGVLDRARRYVELNPALAAMNGVDAQQHAGVRPGEILGNLGAAIEAIADEVLRTGQPLANRRLERPDVAGAHHAWVMSAFPVLGPEREVTGVGYVALDVTAQEQLEGQLRQSQKMEAIGRLAGGVAHDFNNILTVITSYCSLLMDLPPGADPRREAEEIQRAAQRAAGLTRQLLAFSRKQVLQPRVISPNDVIGGMEEMLRRLIGEDVDLVLHLDRDVGDVCVDPGHLEQVLMNLAVNARDAMPDGGQLAIETTGINLSTELSTGALGAAAGEYVVVTVTDTGMGMSEEVQAHLFEPFFTTKPPGRGTGLGLSTVYGIVKQSGGDVHIDSREGRGTSVRIYLPRHHRSSTGGTPPRAAETADTGGTETVLLLEDDDALRMLACRVLERAGYTVLEARNGPEALALDERHAGDLHLLLTDVVMPGMSGRTVSERLQEKRPGLRVLYMSGYNDDDVMRRGIDASEMQFIQKPFTPGQLLRRVRQVLDMQRRRPGMGSAPLML